MDHEQQREIMECIGKIERAKEQHPEHWDAAVEEARERMGALLRTDGAEGNDPELARLSDAMRKHAEAQQHIICVTPQGYFRDVYYFIGKIRNARKQSREHWEAAVVEARDYYGNIFYGDVMDGIPLALKLLEAEINEYEEWRDYQ
ncbi:MAG: hypothetical protein WCV62_04935 [Candidatus Peribacteraceae bacterium]|jgi:hypothetical protein